MIRIGLFLLLCLACTMPVAGQQVHKKYVLADWSLRSTCAEFYEANDLFHAAVSAHEDAQEDFQKCEAASCAEQNSAKLERLVLSAELGRRRLEFRNARLSFLGQVHKILPIAQLYDHQSSRSASNSSSARLSFYLGFKKGVNGDARPQGFDYLKTSLPAIVGWPEVFRRKEYVPYEGNTNYRLYVTPAYFPNGRKNSFFSYSVAGQVGSICDRIRSAGGEVFSFGQVAGSSEKFPIGIEMHWIVSMKERGEESNINFFPILEPFLESMFGISPPTENLMMKYESSCSCLFCRNEGSIVEGIGQIRENLGRAMEGEWATARDVFRDSKMGFEFMGSVREGVYGGTPVMILNVKYGRSVLGQIQFDRFYQSGFRGSRSGWELEVRRIRIDGVEKYRCVVR